MATKKVLKEAIRKLELNTKELMDKRAKTKDPSEHEAISRLIAKNDSMILDYEFRLSQ